jgi:HPt (histidine-containing phosphotransfer) domain-containing protein
MNRLIFDHTAFRRLADGDARRTARLVDVFKSSMRSSLDQLAAAAANRDLGALRAVGHRIKSGPAWIGALGLCEIGQQIEDAASGRMSGPEADLPALVGRAEASFRAAVAEMDEALKSFEDAAQGRNAP